MTVYNVLLLWAGKELADWCLRKATWIAADSLFSLFGLLSRIIFSAIKRKVTSNQEKIL